MFSEPSRKAYPESEDKACWIVVGRDEVCCIRMMLVPLHAERWESQVKGIDEGGDGLPAAQSTTDLRDATYAPGLCATALSCCSDGVLMHICTACVEEVCSRDCAFDGAAEMERRWPSTASCVGSGPRRRAIGGEQSRHMWALPGYYPVVGGSECDPVDHETMRPDGSGTVGLHELGMVSNLSVGVECSK